MGKPAYPLPTREEHLVRVLGECCRKGAAAKELNVSPRTIDAMLADGRLTPACEGTRVCVRSLAAYMDRPADMDYKARLARRTHGKMPRYYVT